MSSPIEQRTTSELSCYTNGMNKRIFSGMQPSGEVHLGNYLGAIQHWVELQKDNDVIITIVDLHAITVPQEPEQLRRRSIELARVFLACGIDPKQTILFKQSDIAEHSELTWILNCIAYMGELSRMIQYKEKSKKVGAETSSVGLFDYPVLQAADILLYNTDLVPVGEDQRQHVELTRDLADRFNKRFGDTFILPQAEIFKTGARVMGLVDPTRKMSKSDGPSSYIGLLDSEEVIRSKVKKAVTTPDGLNNLLSIFSLMSDRSEESLIKQFEGKNLDFKTALSDLLIEKLAAVQGRYRNLSDEAVLEVLDRGAEQASELANAKLRQVKQRVGLA